MNAVNDKPSSGPVSMENKASKMTGATPGPFAAGLAPGHTGDAMASWDKMLLKMFWAVTALAAVALAAGWFLLPHGEHTSTATLQPVAGTPATPAVPAPTAATVPPPQAAARAASVPTAPAVEENRSASQLIAESGTPQDLVVAAARKLDQGDPGAAVLLLLEGDRRGSAAAALDLARLYDPALPHRFDIPSPDLGYSIEHYIRARDRAGDEGSAAAARERLGAIRAALEAGRATDPGAAAAMAKYFR